ncbi:DENN domain-containing protein 3 [Lissotriton helveticus]
MEEVLPSAVLEVCVLLGAPAESIAHCFQVAQRGSLRKSHSLDPEVLSVFVPPFAVKDEPAPQQAIYSNFNKTTRRRSFRKKKEKAKAENVNSPTEELKDQATEDVSVPKDIDLVGLPQLCFPGGLSLTSERKEDHFHFLVFTDVFGNRTHGVVAQYYRLVQHGHILTNGQVSWDSSMNSTKTFDCFVPFAVCVISKYPYYNALKDCLSCLLVQLRPCKDFDIEGRIKEFAAKLALVPSPPPGPLHLIFNMKPLNIVFPSRMDPDSTITDLDLHTPLLCFTPEQVLKIISCILTEHRIVFFSADWALLTLVSECFMLYLHPLQWQHTYVPILSCHMLDFLMAPTCFLMGCHLSHFDEVSREAEDLILINIDDGTMYSTAGENSIEIPSIPCDAADPFVRRVKGLRLHFDLECAHLNSGTDLENLRTRRKLWQQNLNSEIQEIALKLIVSIFREIANAEKELGLNVTDLIQAPPVDNSRVIPLEPNVVITNRGGTSTHITASITQADASQPQSTPPVASSHKSHQKQKRKLLNMADRRKIATAKTYRIDPCFKAHIGKMVEDLFISRLEPALETIAKDIVDTLNTCVAGLMAKCNKIDALLNQHMGKTRGSTQLEALNVNPPTADTATVNTTLGRPNSLTGNVAMKRHPIVESRAEGSLPETNMCSQSADKTGHTHQPGHTLELPPEAAPLVAVFTGVLETVMFHSFLKARLNKSMDAFTRMELTTPSVTNSVGSESPRRRIVERAALTRFRPEHMFSKRLVISMPDLQVLTNTDPPARHYSLRKPETANALKIPQKTVHTFKLPDVNFPLMSRSVQSYYVDFCNSLTRAMNNPSYENSVLMAQYYYLRGLIYLMQGKLQLALSDFQNLYKTDIRIFPLDLVRKVVENMPPTERAQAERKPELKRLISQVMEKEREVAKIDDHVKNFELPEKHMQQCDFVKRIQESGIVKDNGTIDRLFEALTIGHQKQIDPETFRHFYTYWKETEAEAQDVDLPPVVLDHLDKTECVYKVSSSVKTNYGVGKIAMTQKRLFLLTEGGRPGYFEISTFRNIEDVKCTTVAFLLLRIPTLKIKTVSRKEIFEANLKSECDLWHLMVKEMVAGRKMADDYKDPQYVQEALTNVLLMDAVVGSLQSPKAIYAATKLSHFDRQKNEVPMMVPKTTSETLKHRINPSAGETVLQSVDVLLYTPGQLDSTERNVEAQSKLWCALSEGKVVVFNAITWSILQHCFKVGNEKLTCMRGVDHSQVWIGSQNSIIYIINTHSMSCNRQLTDHRSAVVDIFAEEGNKTHSEVHTCSSDGTIITWETSSLIIRRTFQVECRELKSAKLVSGFFWFCTRDHILKTSKEGRIMQKVSITDDLKDMGSPLRFLQLFPEKEQLWIASTGSSSNVYIWDAKDLLKPPKSIQLPDCTEISCMIKVKSQIWIGSKGLSQGKSKGKIYVIDADKKSVEKELVAHADAVKSLCSAEDRYVLSGSGREDGKIAIWTVE